MCMYYTYLYICTSTDKINANAHKKKHTTHPHTQIYTYSHTLTYCTAWTMSVGLHHKAKAGVEVGSFYNHIPDSLRGRK